MVPIKKQSRSFLPVKLMVHKPLPLTNLHPLIIRVRDWMRDSDLNFMLESLRTVEKTGSGDRIRTYDLRVMSPCSYISLYF